MYEESDRLQDALAKRQKLEQELHDAEILFGLLQKHLQAADAYIKQLTGYDHTKHKRQIAKVTPELEQAVIERWQSGERHFSKIGLEVGGLAAMTVKGILVRRGLYLPRKPISPALRQQIIDRFAQGEGESIRKIAKTIGYSKATVQRVLHQAGFETDPVVRKARLKEGGTAMRQNRTLRSL